MTVADYMSARFDALSRKTKRPKSYYVKEILDRHTGRLFTLDFRRRLKMAAICTIHHWTRFVFVILVSSSPELGLGRINPTYCHRICRDLFVWLGI